MAKRGGGCFVSVVQLFLTVVVLTVAYVVYQSKNNPAVSNPIASPQPNTGSSVVAPVPPPNTHDVPVIPQQTIDSSAVPAAITPPSRIEILAANLDAATRDYDSKKLALNKIDPSTPQYDTALNELSHAHIAFYQARDALRAEQAVQIPPSTASPLQAANSSPPSDPSVDSAPLQYSSSAAGGKDENVSGYVNKNGRYVEPYRRR